MVMKGVSPLRLKLQQQHPQTHASASVSTTLSAKLRLSGARRSCSLQVRDHLQASWISRAGAAAARFPAGGPPRLYQERQVRRRGLRHSPELGALRLPKNASSTLDHYPPYRCRPHAHKTLKDVLVSIFWHGPLCLSGVLSVFFRGELRVGAVRWCWVRVTRAAGARYAGWGRPATRA